MRPSDSRTQSWFPAEFLFHVALVVLCCVQASAIKQQVLPFRFPDKNELQGTHTGKSLEEIGLGENEIDQLTGIIWDSGTMEPALPSDYVLRGELLARRVDFGNGEQYGLVLQATKRFCDALGNCRTWFFRKTGDKWQSVAKQRTPSEGVRISYFAIQKSATGAAPDLILIRHSIADNYPTHVWKFDKDKYAPNKSFCWHRTAEFFEAKPCVDFQLPEKMHGSHQSSGISEGDLDNETVAELIAMTVGKRDADKEMLGDKDPEEELLATHLDLGDGLEEGLVVQGSEKLCGATGNCAMWFLRKVEGRWKLIQFGGDDGTEVFVSMFAAVPPKHNGLNELIFGSHFNASETPYAQLWFDGEKYVLHQTYCEYSETREVLAGACE